MSLPKVYISILNWNGSEQTIRCLRSLECLDYSNYQVIVVDNDSHDDSVQHIRAVFPDVHLVRADTNRGYAGGNELALKEALPDPQAELFWILNNDTIVRPESLTALVRAYQQHGEALYGGVPLNENSENDEWRIQTNIWEIGKDGRYYQRILSNFPFQQYFLTTEPRIVAGLSGSTLLIPTSIVRKHGFIDTSFFLYSEEIDYCLRLRRAGIKSYIVPESVVFHVNGGSRRDRPELKPVIVYYQTRARLVLAHRHLGGIAYILTLLKHCFYVAGWLVSGILKGRLAFKSAYFMMLGIRDALLNRMGKTYAPENILSATTKF